MSGLDMITFIIVLIGAFNWGLIGLFDFDLVTSIFGSGTLLTRVTYVIIGLSAIYLAAIAPSWGERYHKA
ncbi:MAG: DUF378 domain-containing protein [Candidatus Roizmanbacteria bacterium]|nr:MAG: DUF378 domain-containing protein [Candidatus Roizmanbacteria bacterium]